VTLSLKGANSPTRLLLRGHANAGVGDGKFDEAPAVAHLACRKLDLARFCELAGIAAAASFVRVERRRQRALAAGPIH
jgi:hypothetical protein